MVFLGQALGWACYKPRPLDLKVPAVFSAPKAPEPGPSAEHSCGFKRGVVSLYLPLAGALLPGTDWGSRG